MAAMSVHARLPDGTGAGLADGPAVRVVDKQAVRTTTHRGPG